MNAAAAMIETHPRQTTIESSLLGTLRVEPEQVFGFERGILGFPECKGFALVATDRDGMFWLQSTECEALTFLLVDPFRFVEGYAVDLGEHELGALAPREASDVLVMSIITLPRTPGDAATANLQGPIALNLVERRGCQVVIQDSPYGVKHPVELGGTREAEG